jgi:hypothetical protein
VSPQEKYYLFTGPSATDTYPSLCLAAVRTALRSLGYLETYHMRAASTETPRDCELWMQAIKAKWDGEGKFDKQDWDQLLGHCQAVCDLPAAAFAPELIAAYPNAKVILTMRDPESWHK